jgi:ribosome-binding protein aMBF1 (putative translation factor)
MSPGQCRAARAWLGWSRNDLATRADIPVNIIHDFEAERRDPAAADVKAIRRAFRAKRRTQDSLCLGQ